MAVVGTLKTILKLTIEFCYFHLIVAFVSISVAPTPELRSPVPMTTGTGAIGGSWAAASPTNGQGPPATRTVIIIPDDMSSQLAPSVTDSTEDPTAAGSGRRPVHDPEQDVPPPQKRRRRGRGGVRRNCRGRRRFGWLHSHGVSSCMYTTFFFHFLHY